MKRELNDRLYKKTDKTHMHTYIHTHTHCTHIHTFIRPYKNLYIIINQRKRVPAIDKKNDKRTTV